MFSHHVNIHSGLEDRAHLKHYVITESSIRWRLLLLAINFIKHQIIHIPDERINYAFGDGSQLFFMEDIKISCASFSIAE